MTTAGGRDECDVFHVPRSNTIARLERFRRIIMEMKKKTNTMSVGLGSVIETVSLSSLLKPLPRVDFEPARRF